jgi:nucleoside-diphosphate-sugar epimerase
MRIAITGAKGFIGTALGKALKDYEVVAIDDADGGVCNYALLTEQFKGCDAVIHLAALVGTRAIHPFDEFFGVNVLGTWNVVKAMTECSVPRLLLGSTTAVRTLRNNYATTKAISETLARGLCKQRHIDFLGLRMFNVYGPGQTPANGALIPTVIEDIKNGRTTIIHGSGQQSRDFIYIDDVVTVFLEALRSETPYKGLCLDVGTGWSTRVMYVVRSLYAIADKQPQIRLVRVDDDTAEKWSRADTNLCQERFGITKFVTLKEGLEMTWLRYGRRSSDA